MSVLVADNLNKHYRIKRGLLRGQSVVKALNGVSFNLAAGETLAVVGESGCGKSTLARQLTLIEEPTSGKLIIDGKETSGVAGEEKKRLHAKVQMVFQNPYASLNPRKKIKTILAEPLIIAGAMSQKESQDKVQMMMAKVGLRPEFAQRYPHMFSGGQRQRIAIARALMLNPKVVVADEPVSALDVSIQAQILNLFNDLQNEFGVSYVFISHNLSVVEHVADNVIVMYLGNAVESGSKQKIFARPLHPYTQALLASTPSLQGRSKKIISIKGELPSPLNPPTGCAFNTRCPHAVARCKEETPLARLFDERMVACHRVEEVNL
ncbi:MAG: dipeptide ABC transporter ATP-binding protein [Burkholderiales bacterium]